MPFNFRHYHLPKVLEELLAVIQELAQWPWNWYKPVERLQTLQGWLIKEGGVPASFEVVAIKYQPTERTFEMVISVIDIHLHYENINGVSSGKQVYMTISLISPCLNNFWSVWCKSQSIGICKWKQEYGIPVYSENQTYKQSARPNKTS